MWEFMRIMTHKNPWISPVAALLAQLGFVATVYKDVGRVPDILDVAFLFVDYNPDMEVGQHSLSHRAKASLYATTPESLRASYGRRR
jgi:hypothetical protein